MKLIKLSDAVASAIEVDVLDGRDDDVDPPSYATLRAHFVAPASLREPATPEDATLLVNALNELSNSHDCIIESSNASADEKRFARKVCQQIYTTMKRIR